MKSRKILIIIGVVAVIIIGSVIIMLTSLNRIVAAAIERYGSMVTQTKVSVSSVDISLTAGTGSISGLTVGNPSGFSGTEAFQLGNISAKIDTGSITKDMAVIDNITISGPNILYEINESGKSNINIIKKNVQQFQGQGPSGKTENQKKGTEKTGKAEKTEKSVKLLIRKLVIDKGKIDVRIAALDKPLSVPLPTIVLSNIGGKGGASPEEVGAEILTALTNEVGSAASRVGVDKYLGKTIDEITKGMTKGSEPLKAVGGTVKKLFGQ